MDMSQIYELANEFQVSPDCALNILIGISFGFGIGIGFCFGQGCNLLAHGIERLYLFLKKKFSGYSNKSTDEH